MNQDETDYLSEAELDAFFNALFPHGILGNDVLNEFGPGLKWKFPTWRSLARSLFTLVPGSWQPQFSIEIANTKYESRTSLGSRVLEAEHPQFVLHVAQCLWDVFSDNNQVITADGRGVGNWGFRGWSHFMNEQITKTRELWREEDYFYFGLGDYQHSHVYDVNEIHLMIFRRLKAQGADWLYNPPENFLMMLGETASDVGASRSGKRLCPEEEALIKDLIAMREALPGMHQGLLGTVCSDPPPVAAYRSIYGRNPRGWLS
ncbi:MAG: hypothetical protein JNN07_27725 [Verrucomicrobiales bacterium]|nr:hypothetical protein [Verrucomicrobiales bacterium]